MRQLSPGELDAYRVVVGAGRNGTCLANIPEGSAVVPRFRALPFGEELAEDIVLHGSVPINTYREHRNIASLWNWVGLLEEFTPPAYTVHDIPRLPEGEWFVKGETNSIKNRWFECAYAPTTSHLPAVVHALQQDVYVGSQDVVIRPFQNYRKVGEGATGQPFFNERRAFFLDGELLSDAPYRPLGDVRQVDSLIPGRQEAVLAAAARVVFDANLARFVVVDTAEYETGDWGVVELNDGSMSGLSGNDPWRLWSNFLRVLGED